MYSNYDYETSFYVVLFTTLIFIAFAEFGGIILYCFYINHLYKIKCLRHLIMKMKNTACRFKLKSKRNPSQNDCVSLDNYEQYQEELLAVDPLN